MINWVQKVKLKGKPSGWLGAGLCLFAMGLMAGVLVGIGMLVGALVATHYQPATGGRMPETLLQAAASHGGENFAMATGQISDEAEGVFFLDFLTGELQCWVLYPRSTGTFGAKFTTNVVKDLGVQQGKKPSYLMVTGLAAFPRGGGLAQPALSVVYVADANTGNFAAYSVPWNRGAERTGQPLAAQMMLVGSGKARNLELRD